MTRKLLIPFLLAATSLAGCHLGKFLVYLVAPQTKKVAAECPKLPGRSVVIVVYCDRRVQYEYPNVCLSLSSAVAEELARNVKKLNVIDPRRVVRYQDGNIYWEEMDKTQLGKAFGADYILFLSLVEYGTREPGSLNLYRGRINAQVSLYDVSMPERDARVWQARSLRAVYPEHSPAGVLRESDGAVRDKVERLFADKLAKKFYDHKVRIE